MRVAIIGGGFYGCVIALRLCERGIEVDLFERCSELLTGAIRSNQHRLHLGFHYPRCDITIAQAIAAFSDFCNEYPSAVEDIPDNFYCVHSDGNVSDEEYRAKMVSHSLSFSDAPVPEQVVVKDRISLSIRVQEKMINLSELCRCVLSQIEKSDVNVIPNTERTPSQLSDDYDFVVNCTYTDPGADISLKTKSELAVMLLARSPDAWIGRAITIMDGQFCSVYPSGPGLHTISSVAYTPAIKCSSSKLLEKIAGQLDNDDWKRIESSIFSHASELIDLSDFEIVGRYTTVKTKLEHDKNDFRGTVVYQEDRIISVLPGKISCAFLAAEDVIKKVGIQWTQSSEPRG